ncbi:hypothetical protein BPGQ101_02610 [Bacillus altitudinis]|nr:hypothetical protein [Bacillus altitudinis]QCU17813.1 hypothetical protein BPGQ101_02610 [Bacillus altitudinis]
MSVLRAGAHECEIRSAPVLVFPRLQRFSITLKRRKRAKLGLALFGVSSLILFWRTLGRYEQVPAVNPYEW